MVELVILGVVLLAIVAVGSVLAIVGSIVGAIIALPFRLLGWLLGGLGMLLAFVLSIPALLIGGVVGGSVLLLVGGVLLLLPFVVLFWLGWKLFANRAPDPSNARVVS